ncbi:beta strand repeat-containing protein [Stieleria marina]|uniref:Putative outer membrane protein pmp20 n=1 Tax=Stieleria marina TaxID=1930275 RepID=A0A517NVS9_9BACT|nr:putative outer membrane protein pmp20 precursor [Planctomycetes bacterium K23_9]
MLSTENASAETPASLRTSSRHKRRRSRPISSRRAARTRRLSCETLEARRVLTAYLVTTLDDTVAADGEVSLREAIQASNTNAAVGDAAAGVSGAVAGAPGDSITFAAALSSETISLSGGQFSISDDLAIALGDASSITIDGGGDSRVFLIDGGGPSSIDGLTITGGNDVNGGGMFVSAGQTLTLSNVNISGNVATGDAATEGGGGVYSEADSLTISDSVIESNQASGASGSGGGIFSAAGSTTLDATNVRFNSANRAGGGVEVGVGTFVFQNNSALTNNDVNGLSVLATAPAPGNGGGLHVTGAANVSLTGGSVFGNEAASEGGGLWNNAGTMTIDGTLIDSNFVESIGGDADAQGGGGVFNNGGILNISNATISNNEALDPDAGATQDDGGGGLFNNGGTVTLTDTDLTANFATDGLGNGGAILSLGGSVVISGGTITANEAARAGGGIENNDGAVTLNAVTVGGIAGADGNLAGINGGGLHVSAAGTTNVNDGSFQNNVAMREGGGLWNNAGTMTIDGTMVTGNTASGDESHDGGGGVFNNGGTLDIIGATISANLANGASGSGGGVFSTDGDVDIQSSTIGLNGANRAGGGIEIVEGNLTLTGSNLVNNDVDGTATGGPAAPGNGGGLHVSGAVTTVIDGGSVFGNVAQAEGGGLWNSGTGTMTIRNGTIIEANEALGDSADQGGGGIFNNGGTLAINGTASAIAVVDNFASGTSGSGGGLLSVGGNVTIDNADFDLNAANRAGGGIEIAGGTMTINDTNLTNNDVNGSAGMAAPGNGGALHISGFAVVGLSGGTVSGNAAANEGGGLWNSNVGILGVDGATIENNTAVVGGGIFTQSGSAQAVRLTMVNSAPNGGPTDSGLFLTPVFTAFHDGGFDLFNAGETASAELERIAEDGNNGPITAAFAAGQANGVSASLPGGPFSPGATETAVFVLDPVDNRYYSYASMVIPSNDAFIANDDAQMLELFDADGNLLPIDFTVTGAAVWDAGTELNDETDAAFFDQMAADTGTAESAAVTSHAGFINSVGNPGGTSIILGGTQSVGPMRTFGTANADFTSDGYELLQVTIEDAGSGTSLVNVIVNANTATGDAATEGGGGIFHGDGLLRITGGAITNNVANGMAGSGGGILNLGGTIEVTSAAITGNTANRAGGGIESAANSMTNLMDVNLDDNIAGPASLAAPGNGGGLHITGAGDATIVGGTVSGNFAAAEGGGLWNGTGTMTIDGTTIQDNSAAGNASDQGGGGIFNAGGAVDIARATISNNLAASATTFALSGTQEVPSVTTTSMGQASLQYNPLSGTFRLDAFVSGIELTDQTALPELTGAHIHLGDAGTNGDVIINLGIDTWQTVDGGIRFLADDVAVPAANVSELLAGGTYLNIHSTNNPGGEVRGQVTFPATMGSGGGILNDQGSVTILNSSISDNVASRAGGGIESNVGTTTLSGVNLDRNIAGASGAATPGNGGGLHITGAGNATISGGTVNDNRAGREGGGLWNGSGVMTVNGTTISDNTASGPAADDGGGGIFNNGGDLQLTSVSIANNTADGASSSGGGILNLGGSLSVVDSSITGNEANRAGGGIETTGGSTVSITNSAIDFNSLVAATVAPGNGGGIHIGGDGAVTVSGGSVSDNEAIEGGGLWNSSAGTLTVDGTTVSGNTAVAGGGIYNDAAAADADQTFSLDFIPLNGSSVTGTGSVTVSSPTATTRTIRVVIDAEGLQDVSAFGGLHVAHIHGQFAGNATRPVLEQGDGPFFDGDGGAANGFPPTASVPPSLANDDGRTIADGFLDFLEGRPQYGPVVLNLTSVQLRDASATSSNPPEGVPPLGHFLALVGGGDIDPAALFPSGTEFDLDTTYTFDLTNADEARQFNNIAPAGLREIVLHGQTVDTAISDAIDAVAMGTAPSGVDLGDGSSFRITAPVGVSLITPVSGGVTVTNASVSGNIATGDDLAEGGGGIHNSGSLSVTDSDITGNSATGSAGSGGGIWNGGIASISDSTINVNVANRAGGGIEATDTSTTTLVGVSLNANVAGPDGTAAPGNGGGLHVSGAGTTTIADSSIVDNVAAREGGGLWNGSGVMTVFNSDINQNVASGDSAVHGGGGIFNSGGNLQISQSEITRNFAEGSSGSGGGLFNLDGTVSVTDTVISRNVANRAGGGIEDNSGQSLSLLRVQLTGNDAGSSPGNGGGLHLTGDGTVQIDASLIARNSADNEGGGLWNSASGTISVSQSTISNNLSGSGGGVFNDGSGGDISLNNSTIANNFATGSGGGLATEGGSLTISSATIAYNTAPSGGGIEVSGGDVDLSQTLIASNNATVGPNISGTVTSSGNNLIADTTDAVVDGTSASDLTNVDARIGVLTDNGGLTPTIALLAGSPAINAGVAMAGDVDQRGVSRPQGGQADIGAFESDLAGTASLTLVAVDSELTEGDSGMNNFTFRVTRSGSVDGELMFDFRAFGSGNNPASVGDFTTTSQLPAGTVTFADQQAEVDFMISILGDNDVEATETFTVQISNPSGGANIAVDSATATITNDDVAPAPTLSITAADGDELEGNADDAIFTFVVNRSSAVGNAAVDFAVVGTGTDAATADDFVGAVLPSGTLNFVDGESSQTISIPVAGDDQTENDETFSVTLSNAAAPFVIQTATAAGTIRNDDMDPVTLPPLVSIAGTDSDKAEGDTGTSVLSFTVTRSANTDGVATVDYTVTGSGTNAANADDFAGGVFETGTVTFADGESTQTILINVAGDTLVEPDETFDVTLSNASTSVVLQNGVASGVIRNDDVSDTTSSFAIAATDSDRNEGDTGTTPFTFTVTRSGSLDSAAMIDYSVAGTSSANASASDFGGTLPTGTVVFDAGQSTGVVTVNVSGDMVVEPSEQFTVTLVNAAAGNVIATPSAIGTIRNDDSSVIIESRVIAPLDVARAHSIPASTMPTAIIFRVVSPTTISVVPIGAVSFTDNVRILDDDLFDIATYVDGFASADASELGFHAVIFEASTTDRLYSIRSSAGPNALQGQPKTNLLQPTDTDGDSQTSPADALAVLNALASQAEANRGNGAQGESAALIDSEFYVDVNRDGELTPSDVLVVLNHLSDQANANQASGEQLPSDFLGSPSSDADDTAVRDEALALLDSSDSVDNGIDEVAAGQSSPIELDTIDRIFAGDDESEQDLVDDELELLSR